MASTGTAVTPLCPRRMESDDESDSPDSIVPASSPESVLGEELLRFPLLSEAKPELEERVLSPIIPIIPRASIPGGFGWSRGGARAWNMQGKAGGGRVGTWISGEGGCGARGLGVGGLFGSGGGKGGQGGSAGGRRLGGRASVGCRDR